MRIQNSSLTLNSSLHYVEYAIHFRGKTAVESILPDTLQEFLDEDCISGKGVVTAEEFSITFDYGFLAPPLLNEKMALPSDEQEVS